MDVNKIRILFARTGELWWDGLTRLLNEHEQFEIVDVCYDEPEATRKTKLLKPDIVLLDEEMLGHGSGEVTKSLNQIHPDTHIIIVSKPYKDIDVVSIFKMRARAYIDRDITLEELIETVEKVVKGGMVVISPLVATHLLRFLGQITNGKEAMRKEFDINLSKREMQILELLTVKGTTNKEIASELCITENTVKSHIANIMWKMNVRNRQQAAALAREKGIIA
jgi:DNA-binding NarL/FixJ family response regulator